MAKRTVKPKKVKKVDVENFEAKFEDGAQEDVNPQVVKMVQLLDRIDEVTEEVMINKDYTVDEFVTALLIKARHVIFINSDREKLHENLIKMIVTLVNNAEQVYDMVKPKKVKSDG